MNASSGDPHDQTSSSAGGHGSRRDLLQAASGFALAASGLLLPAGVTESAPHPVDKVRHRAGKRQQRKHVRLKQRRHGSPKHNAGGSAPLWRGISLWLGNLTAPQTLHIECGGFYDGSCDFLAVFNLPPFPSDQPLFDTSEKNVYAWVDNRYWLEFNNPFIDETWIRVGDGGSAGHRCHYGGHELLPKTEMIVGAERTILLDGYKVVIDRDRDKTNFKYFHVAFYAR